MSEILNRIPEEQNSPRFIEYLAAFSSLYSQAKVFAGVQAILTVPIPIALSLLALLFPGIRVWAAFYGIVISVLDIALIDFLQQEKKKEAAKVQELFDCELLDMPWREFVVGDKPIRERIIRAAEHFLKKPGSRSKILDWYPANVGRLPLHLARVVCQRSNVFFDVELRQYYLRWLNGILIGLVVLILAFTIMVKMSMEAIVLSISAPVFPTILWLIREIRKQKQSTERLARLIRYVEKLLDDAIGKKISKTEIEAKSRELQDELYVHRYTNQPIFNWIYDRLKKRLNFQMTSGAEAIVDNALQSLEPGSNS